MSTVSLLHQFLTQADIRINGTRAWDIHVHRPAFYQRVLQHGSLGLGESYMDGWWDCSRLDDFFTRIFQAQLDQRVCGGLKEKVLRMLPRLFNLQAPRRAFTVGRKHYDLGNELYQAMLDSRMIYSCGYWKNAHNLEEAQEHKLELICQKLQLAPGLSLLDIGCGFGGLAKYAAEHYGVNVLGVTVSAEQAKLAQENCRGLPVEIALEDYRQLDQPFDRVVSVGMFEHVGYKNYRTYMQVVQRCLKDTGLFLLHTIGSSTSVTAMDPWFGKYIFPNSQLPSAAQISQASEGCFVLEDWHSFGADYDQTLLAWHRNFVGHWHQLKEKYDERFYRMWKYYLLASAASFRARQNQLWQIVFSKNGVAGGYVSVR